MQFKGKITEWDDMRGFGFIAPLNGNARVFVHISAFPAGSRRPGTGEFINYSVGQDDRGRVCATSATYVTQQSHRVAVHLYGRRAALIAGFVSGSFLTTVTLLAVVGRLWWPVAFGYGAMSIATYRAYKHDKQAAQAREWRTNEWELIVLGLIGGWPGGLIARHRFRHKTRKVTFQLAYWLSVVLNLSGLAWLLAS
jgi:uncharacterized membrane protein YsdA (DUF1294 family)/cold shock CspA family protein